ncbi:lectin-like domain-containing protein [Chryseobacterium sp. Mn2064]|uniref:lectin-like domain-containing protein n=1 Tax=Chryseobacterium sp. Mn2064 TaxID=3395263 RepID=UPI003BE649CF
MLKNTQIIRHKQLLFIGSLFIFSQNIKAQNEQGTGYPYFVNFTQGLQPQEAYKVTTSGVQNDATFTTDGLRLTRSVNNISGGVILADKIFKSDQGIKFEFEFAIYGGNTNGGDGISIFLVDGSIPKEQLNLGYFGGGLGYSFVRGGESTEGLRGAYLGIGLDEFGNFKTSFNQGERVRNGIFGVGLADGRSNVSLRGKRGNQSLSSAEPAGYNGYPLLYSIATNASPSSNNRSAYLNPSTGKYVGIQNTALQQFSVESGGTTIPLNENDARYRKAYIVLVPNPAGGYNITLEIQHGTVKEKVIDNYYYPTSLKYTETTISNSTVRTLDTSAPATFRIGFAASTGAAKNIHLLKNLGVTRPYAAEVTDDLFAGCPGIKSTFYPLLNDAAYSSASGQNPPTLSYNNLDFNSFRFLDNNGAVIPNITGGVYTSSQGTWTYSATTGALSFRPANGFTGVAQIQYDIKGGGRNGTEDPYNKEEYRSLPALVQVNISSANNCSKACVISNKNVTQNITK